MKNVRTGVYTYNGEDFNFDIYTELNINEKMIFVRSVVDTLVDDKYYDFILRDIIFNFMLIKMMTDINTNKLFADEETNNIRLNEVEKFLEETNIIDIIKVNTKDSLIEELDKAVNLSVEHRTGIHQNPLNEALASLINTLESKVSEYDLNSAITLAAKFLEIKEDFTPESIVNAYVNSDVHKDNMIELAEVKKQRTKIAKEVDKTIKADKKKQYR